MTKTYITSDIHLNHKNIIKYCPNRGDSVEEMNEKIISNWNSIITQDDTTIIVGDVAMGIVKDAIPLIRRLNGSKILVYGNHDRTLRKLIKEPENQDLFKWVGDYYTTTHVVDGVRHFIVCNHFGMLNWESQESGSINFFGHSHSSPENRFPNQYRQMDVGIDGHNLFPYLLDDAVRLVREREIKGSHHR